MEFENTVTFASYANSGVAIGLFKYPEEQANSMIAAMGIVRYQFVGNDDYAKISDVPPISSLLTPTPVHNAVISYVVESYGGNTIANAARFFQIPANATVVYDQVDITADVAYSNANVVVANTNLGPAGYYVDLEPGEEDGEYTISISHPEYDEYTAQVACNGATITIDWT